MVWLGRFDHCRTQAGGCRALSQDSGTAADAVALDSRFSLHCDMAFLWVLALFSLLLHLATASRYDFYTDELYVIAASRHSLWCCAETFTLQLWVSRLSAVILGTSHIAVRFLPAVAGSANILVAGLLAREFGGGRFAIALAGLGVFVAPVLLLAATMAGTFSYECLFWTISALLVMRTLRTGNGRLWWLVGVVWGMGFLAKPPILLFMLAVGFGILLTRARVELLRKGYWLALGVALVFSTPVLTWQAFHGWPILGLAMRPDEYAELGNWMGFYTRTKMVLAQPAFVGPLNFVLAVVGVFHGLVYGRQTAFRAVLWACVAASLAFVATSGHPYYMNPVYSMLVALGCVAADRVTAKGKARWMRPLLVAGLVAQGLVIAPLCMPLLPQASLDSYSRFVCRGMLAPLSGVASFLHGEGFWALTAMKLNGVCETLPAGERENCCIIEWFAPVAVGAEFYGSLYDLPKIFSPHLNGAFWGPPDEGTGPVIAQCFNRKDLKDWFGSVEYAGGPDDAYMHAFPVYICRFPKCGYQEIWRDMCNRNWFFRWKVKPDDGLA